MSLRFISLSSILLFIFGIVDLVLTAGTQVIAFTYFLIGISVLFALDIYGVRYSFVRKYKKYLYFVLIGWVSIWGIVHSISVSRQGGAVHDNVLQMTAAIEFIMHGKNPYTENYINTEMIKLAVVPSVTGQPFINTALYHCIKLPFHLLFSLIFYLFIKPFDVRFVYLLLYLVGMVVVYGLPRKQESKILLTVLYTLNPLVYYFTAAGRDDVFVLTWLVIVLLLLKYKNYIGSAIFMGIALASKQSSWLFLPFYLIYLYYINPAYAAKIKVRRAFNAAIISLTIMMLFLMPFIISDFKSFWEDIYLFPTGGISTSYPINGYGFSSYALINDWIGDMHDYFPSWIFQLVFCVPLFIFLYKQIKTRPSIGVLCLAYGLFVFVFWFFSRFFNDNYIGYITQILLLGYFMENENNLGTKDTRTVKQSNTNGYTAMQKGS